MGSCGSGQGLQISWKGEGLQVVDDGRWGYSMLLVWALKFMVVVKGSFGVEE